MVGACHIDFIFQELSARCRQVGVMAVVVVVVGMVVVFFVVVVVTEIHTWETMGGEARFWFGFYMREKYYCFLSAAYTCFSSVYNLWMMMHLSH